LLQKLAAYCLHSLLPLYIVLTPIPMHKNIPLLTALLSLLLLRPLPVCAQKPPLTLDDHFNSVSFTALKVAPDGNSVVIGTQRADWDQQIFRKDLWLYRDDNRGSGNLVQLTQSGHDTQPQWSPDGRWIAFLSERKVTPAKEASDDSESKDRDKDKESAPLYLISPTGGEAFPITQGEEGVHAFSWSPDSRTLYFATRQPWTKEQKDAYKKEWNDVLQYRAAERGDTIFSLDVSSAVTRHAAAGTKETPESQKSDFTPGARPLAQTPWRIQQMETSPDGHHLAFVTTSVSQRQEKIEEFEIICR
jgi:acylaminoacyl-peptidase